MEDRTSFEEEKESDDCLMAELAQDPVASSTGLCSYRLGCEIGSNISLKNFLNIRRLSF